MPYIDDELLEKMINTMAEGFARIEKKLERMNRQRDCLDGDQFLDNVDLAELLGVSQRTLARYREKERIPYYCVDDNGRTLYLASEVRDFIKSRRKGKTVDLGKG